ncbi:MAG: NAD(P)/FAD-dependent oxidoreductase [Acidobacteria bacterium]|nr:NAD(P)/FAD-dependent oxidoreductase [Acidobacteriota bacterium]
MRILILGGGVGGQVVANELRRRLPAEHRVTLIERDTRHAFAPSFLWVMTGDRQPHQVTRDLRELVRPGVDVVKAEIRRIDLANQRVETHESLAYDYLVVALGAELAPDAIPGLASAAHTFYTLDGAARLRTALDGVGGGTVAVVVSALPYKCPGAPHEAAMLLADFFRRRGKRDTVDVHLFTPEPQPMPVAGPILGEAVQQMLAQRRIGFHPSYRLTAVTPDSRELRFDEKPPVKYDLLVAIPPHRAPALVREAGLANDSGWIPVDRQTLATRYEHVYAIGDITAVAVPGRWKPDVPLMLPKAGVFAHAEALVVARRIVAEIAGVAATDTFCGDGFCMLEAGEDLAGIAFGDFFAEPSPHVEVRSIGKAWHLGKVLFESWWLAPWGMRRRALGTALELGSRIYGIPMKL